MKDTCISEYPDAEYESHLTIHVLNIKMSYRKFRFSLGIILMKNFLATRVVISYENDFRRWAVMNFPPKIRSLSEHWEESAEWCKYFNNRPTGPRTSVVVS